VCAWGIQRRLQLSAFLTEQNALDRNAMRLKVIYSALNI
jgi:hypothetical protein